MAKKLILLVTNTKVIFLQMQKQVMEKSSLKTDQHIKAK